MRLSQIKGLVKESAKGFEWELFLLRRENLKISTENGNFEKITTAEDYALAIRLLKDQKMGFAYTTCVEPSAVKNLVQQLKDITENLKPDGGNLFQNTLQKAKAKAPFDREGADLTVDEKIEMVTTFERNLMKLHPYIVGTRKPPSRRRFTGWNFPTPLGLSFPTREAFTG